MDDNPYAPPQAAPIPLPRTRSIRLTLGGVVFIGLGLTFFLLGFLAAYSVNQDRQTPRRIVWPITIGAVELALLGVLLMIYGVVRKTTTLGAVTFGLAFFAVSMFVVAVYFR